MVGAIFCEPPECVEELVLVDRPVCPSVQDREAHARSILKAHVGDLGAHHRAGVECGQGRDRPRCCRPVHKKLPQAR